MNSDNEDRIVTKMDAYGRQSATFCFARAEENKIIDIYVDSIRVIPVIFIPGIMGSNLKTKTDDQNTSDELWRVDSKTSLLGWSLPGKGAIARKKLLHPNKVDIDINGQFYPYWEEAVVNAIGDKHAINEDSSTEEIQAYLAELNQLICSNPEEEMFGLRQDRGWGEVGKYSYGEFLDKLQKALHKNKLDPEERCQMLRGKDLDVEYLKAECTNALNDDDFKALEWYRFPVHAMGYNWLGSNVDSAKRLAERVDSIIAGYKARHYHCSKVILVTHSMGGLVARYYSEVLGGNQHVYGIVHGVMPATGAAATYTRMKRGTENPDSSLEGFIASHILGRNAAEMTAICSQSPGPLQLLPSPEYGMNWLKITDRHGNKSSYPKFDPYGEIYTRRDTWWALCDPHLLNPMNARRHPGRINYDWEIFENILLEDVRDFHLNIANKYHPNTYSFYGLDTEAVGRVGLLYASHQTVFWKGQLAMGEASRYQPVQDPRLAYQVIPEIGDRLDYSEVQRERTVYDALSEPEQAYQLQIDSDREVNWVNIGQRYTLQEPSGNGDGTVPVNSGTIPERYLIARQRLKALHEPAYKNPISQDFTLWAVLKIAQEVKHDPTMAF